MPALNATLPETSGGRPVLAFVWSAFGPYHVARCRAVARRASDRFAVVGIELGATTRAYAWRPSGAQADFPKIRLHNGCAEDVPALSVFLRLRKTLSAIDCRVAFLPSYWPLPSLCGLAAARSLGCATVMMNESHDGTASPARLRRLAKRVAVGQFDAALVGGERHRRYFTSLGMRPERVFVGYDAVDNDLFERCSDRARLSSGEVRARLGLPDRYFLSLGRLVAKKNLRRVLEAFSLFRRRNPDGPALVLVGEGPERNELWREAQSLGLTAADGVPGPQPLTADVLFFGWQQIEESIPFYALADAFVLASTKEEWGLVVNEAMACGVPPLVSSRAGCAQDLVRPDVTGWLFDPDSASELARLMELVHRHPDRALEAGRAARAYVRHWDCRQFADGALAAAEAALGETRASQP